MKAQRFIGWLDAMGVKCSSTTEEEIEQLESDFNKKYGENTIFGEIKRFVADTSFQGELVIVSEFSFIGTQDTIFVFLIGEWVCFSHGSDKKIFVVKAAKH